ncbi:hypothetical protein E4U43_001188 [Claviceps pusilla]|uniref:BTB domain-containing protein n=1 Tax=Claviceps pusilla TaxID=123648 RepID=A0A9P7N8H6_9HYPO|nr:hypothetical protein E4U43_001188 [Claviceps pusilla]
MAAKDTEARNGLMKMLKSKELVDYEIVCQGETIPVHKVIFCAASPVFHAACSTSFKEADGAYHIGDFALHAVRCMVEYMYSRNYKEKSHSHDDDEMSELHIAVFALGDRYMMPGLKKCARGKFTIFIERQPSDPSGFIRSIRDVYRTTPRTVTDLRDVVVNAAARQYRTRLLAPNIKPLYDSLVSDCPDFALDLLARLLSNNGAFYSGHMRRITCDSDGEPYVL